MLKMKGWKKNMYDLTSFLEDLSSNTGIKFSMINEEGSEIFTNDLKDENSEYISFHVNIGNNKVNISMLKEYEPCLQLLRYTIESKYKDVSSEKEQTLIDILDGKEIAIDRVEKNFPFLESGGTLLLVALDGSRYEALNIIKQLYNDQDVLSIIYGDNIIVVGAFSESMEHAESIKASLISELYCKCSVSYGALIYNGNEIKRAYEEAKECVSLSKTFGIKDEIFNYNKMIFEKIVYNIDNNVKRELLNNFKDKFDVFDNEIINTIEQFVNCGLNISDAARKLYVHRNTLIYRLDKINKETGFDIRNFKEATVFIIAFLIWKEKIFKEG